MLRPGLDLALRQEGVPAWFIDVQASIRQMALGPLSDRACECFLRMRPKSFEPGTVLSRVRRSEHFIVGARGQRMWTRATPAWFEWGVIYTCKVFLEPISPNPFAPYEFAVTLHRLRQLTLGGT